MRLSIVMIVGLLFAPSVQAQSDIYSQIREDVESELKTDEADLAIQRFAIGTYYDHALETINDADETVLFEMEEETYMDLSLREQMLEMCGTQESRKNQYITCLQAQGALRRLNERNTWLRTLGRDLQVIASGYEAGIEGYPGKAVDVIAKFAGITHLWRATNDPFVTPILEVLTRARPWPDELKDQIEDKAAEVENAVQALEITHEEKTDRTKVTAAIWRYRHGVRYVKEREGDECEQTNDDIKAYLECLQADGDEASCNQQYGQERPDPAMIMVQQRWCDVEQKLEELSDLIQQDNVEVGNEEHIIYPSYVNKADNFYIWMRRDDVGLQPYLPIEPVQATLYHPEYGDCVAGGNIGDCYEQYEQYLIRGGKYPSKIGDNERGQQPSIMGGGDVPEPPTETESDEEDIRHSNMVVKEPAEGDGICSHPFGKRGYLCRNIEYEACDLTEDQQDQLQQAGTGGIVLTRCEPERFHGDVARRVSGSNVCGIGGWRETVEENLTEDTPERQDDMQVPYCSKCWVDIACEDECVEGDKGFAVTQAEKRDGGIIDICVPKEPDGPPGAVYYLMAHEVIHAQQLCSESNLQSLSRAGMTTPEGEGPEACCAAEREAYFVQCKLMALDGILDKAGLTIDQCASAFANLSCEGHDDDPEDDNYVCSNDGVDPSDVTGAVNAAMTELQETLGLPTSCEAAMNHPRIQALYNSMPPSCSPGCEIQYQNTIGNNLCYTGQCVEETHEFARDIPGRMALTEVSQGFPWDACEKPDPQLGDFEVVPALSGPKFPLYRPALLLRQLDMELCQLNGLPAMTPPILCGFNPSKRLGLPPLNLMQTANDLVSQAAEYDTASANIQYAASAIASRITTDMFIQYLKPTSRHFADLLNTMYDVFSSVGNLEFPGTMCPRYTEDGFDCSQLQ